MPPILTAVPSEGPLPAKVLIVGEAPGVDEVAAGRPFVGASGSELNNMLADAGFIRAQCRVTNVCRYRPPRNQIDAFFYKKREADKLGIEPLMGRYPNEYIRAGLKLLEKEIEATQPELIIALGGVALWALTGKEGIMRWRGSQLTHVSGAKLVPTVHPAMILRQWANRYFAVLDLKRAHRWWTKREPAPSWRFIVRPMFAKTVSVLEALLTDICYSPDGYPLSVDIETRNGHIACIGLAWSKTEAISIPLMCVERPAGYWTAEEETVIHKLLAQVLTHPNVRVIGQNFMYDAQYFAKWLRYVPRLTQDTLILQSVVYAGLPKALHTLASLYCRHYVYWKDDGKEWNPKVPEDRLWAYNCEDAVRTYEVWEVLRDAVVHFGLQKPAEFQHSLFAPVLHMTVRGCAIALDRRKSVAKQLLAQEEGLQQFLQRVLGHPINVRSPLQMQTLLYGDMKLPAYKAKDTGRPTTNDDALVALGKKFKWLEPITTAVRDIRSLGVLRSTFVDAALDSDNRLRCSFNIGGTETYRFASSSNSFGTGTNLQNVPQEQLGVAVRDLFRPDDGYILLDCDLARADAQVVAWEADDAELKQMFREGADLHDENAKAIFGVLNKQTRALAKAGVHAVNYGISARTLAVTLGVSVHEAEAFINRWFAAHPAIKLWQDRTALALQTTRTVSNAFGYRRYYYDRIEGLMGQALAWVPQSTVACVTNRALARIYHEVPEVELLLQVHDSLVMQVPVHRFEALKPAIRECFNIAVPYPDPLVIPVGLKTSLHSWQAVKDATW